MRLSSEHYLNHTPLQEHFFQSPTIKKFRMLVSLQHFNLEEIGSTSPLSSLPHITIVYCARTFRLCNIMNRYCTAPGVRLLDNKLAYTRSVFTFYYIPVLLNLIYFSNPLSIPAPTLINSREIFQFPY